jgi:hypothetical protein
LAFENKDGVPQSSIVDDKTLVKTRSFFNDTELVYLGLTGDEEIPNDQISMMDQRKTERIHLTRDSLFTLFLLLGQINERLTTWGSKNKCDFAIYSPICQSCFALVVLAMFIICGKGGKGDENSYLSEPWRIVSPALFFFIVMTIVSLTNLIIIERGMNSLCDSFAQHLKDVSCATAMNGFMKGAMEEYPVSPAKLRIILTTFNYITLFAWATSALLLVARIIFVIDFQLVRVTVKTVEYENAKENLNVVEVEDQAKGKEATSPC